MENIEQALDAIRTVESDGNYRYQQRVNTSAGPDRKVGAYGILESRWRTLADSLGYVGARWQSKPAQDRIAKEKLERDYKELGDWNLAVVSFRYGLPAARALRDKQAFAPADIKRLGMEQASEYLRAAQKAQPTPPMPVEGTVRSSNPQANVHMAKDVSPNRRRAEDIVRKQLYALRGKKTQGTLAEEQQEVTPDGSNEGQQPL